MFHFKSVTQSQLCPSIAWGPMKKQTRMQWGREPLSGQLPGEALAAGPGPLFKCSQSRSAYPLENLGLTPWVNNKDESSSLPKQSWSGVTFIGPEGKAPKRAT